MPRMVEDRPGDDSTLRWPLRYDAGRSPQHVAAPAFAGATIIFCRAYFASASSA